MEEKKGEEEGGGGEEGEEGGGGGGGGGGERGGGVRGRGEREWRKGEEKESFRQHHYHQLAVSVIFTHNHSTMVAMVTKQTTLCLCIVNQLINSSLLPCDPNHYIVNQSTPHCVPVIPTTTLSTNQLLTVSM